MTPEPIRTVFRKDLKWRWDYFTTQQDAQRYERHRLKVGVGGVKLFAPMVRLNETQWCVASRHGMAPVTHRSHYRDTMAAWPKTKIDHCRHCEERRTFLRIENKGWVKGQPLRRRFTYTEQTSHTCPGHLKEMEELRLTNKKLNEMFFSNFRNGRRR